MESKITNPDYVERISSSNRDQLEVIVENVSQKYDITDPDQFQMALEVWRESGSIEKGVQTNKVMEKDAFYEVAGRCKHFLDESE